MTVLLQSTTDAMFADYHYAVYYLYKVSQKRVPAYLFALGLSNMN